MWFFGLSYDAKLAYKNSIIKTFLDIIFIGISFYIERRKMFFNHQWKIVRWLAKKETGKNLFSSLI